MKTDVLTIGVTSNIRDTHTPVSFAISENGSADNISNVSKTGVTWASKKRLSFFYHCTSWHRCWNETDNIIFDGSFNITFTKNGLILN